MAIEIHEWKIELLAKEAVADALIAFEATGWEIVNVCLHCMNANYFLVVAKRHSHYEKGDGLQG